MRTLISKPSNIKAPFVFQLPPIPGYRGFKTRSEVKLGDVYMRVGITLRDSVDATDRVDIPAVCIGRYMAVFDASIVQKLVKEMKD